MKKMFSSMMAGFTKGMPKVILRSSEEDKKKMREFGEQMAGMCSCMTGKEMSDEEKKAMAGRMTACCGNAKEMMSGFFKKTGSEPEGADAEEKK
jgi:hypothetical protein